LFSSIDWNSTAGYRFSPANITEAVCMSELETVLAASERPAEGMEMRRKLIANHSEFHLEKEFL